MKKIILALAILMGFCQVSNAMLPIDETNVKAAQNFGLTQKNTTTDRMLAPWTVQDRKKANKYGLNERAIVYSPYATVAVSAQSAAKAGKTVSLEESMAVAKEYDGILAVGLVIDSTFKVEPKYLKIKLYQEDAVVEPYATTLEKAVVGTRTMSKSQLEDKNKGGLSESEKKKLAVVKKEVENKSKAAGQKRIVPKIPATNVPVPAEPKVAVKVWSLQYFTYFDLSKFTAKKHVVLKVTDQAGGEREFVLDLPNMK